MSVALTSFFLTSSLHHSAMSRATIGFRIDVGASLQQRLHHRSMSDALCKLVYPFESFASISVSAFKRACTAAALPTWLILCRAVFSSA